jgi:hypothetical protein
MGKYDELKERKDSGEILDISMLNEEMLRELWWDENTPDSIIADLFDVDKKVITNKRYKFGLRQQECQARHFATILTEYGDALRDTFVEKDKPIEKEMDNDKILDELNLIIMELYAREVSNNCVVRELQSESWVALCDRGIELFKQLKA